MLGSEVPPRPEIEGLFAAERPQTFAKLQQMYSADNEYQKATFSEGDYELDVSCLAWLRFDAVSDEVAVGVLERLEKRVWSEQVDKPSRMCMKFIEFSLEDTPGGGPAGKKKRSRRGGGGRR